MLEQVKAIIAKQLRIDASSIDDNACIVEDLGADSLDMAEMVAELEDAFSITIADDDAAELRTVADVALYLEECVKS